MTRWPLVRFAVHGLTMLALIVGATIATRLLVPPERSPLHALVWVKNLLLPLVLFAAYGGLVALMERRRAGEIDPRKGLPTFVLGLVLGAALIGAVVFGLSRLGMVEIAAGTGLQGLAAALAMPLVTAMMEELLFRVILFGVLEEIAGSLIAIIVSSALFGLAHAGNPGANPFALFALSVEAGVMLSLAYMLTRNIWIAVGLHAAWNFTQAFVFGALNSGVRDPATYFRTTFTGPDLLTGGLFGLEGSAITLGACVIVSIVLLLLIAHRRRWIGVRFRLGAPAT